MTFQFKIQLKNLSKPTVWRRILVPETFTFHELHNVIQSVFPWDNYHSYQFSPSGYGSMPLIALNSKEYQVDLNMESSETALKDVFKTEKQTYTYIYDFGDDWIHKITLEKILPEKIAKPICIKGKGKCPPEDCGGVWGYQDLLEIISDPKHYEYTEMRDWLRMEDDEIWDVNEFDLDEVNDGLAVKFGK